MFIIFASIALLVPALFGAYMLFALMEKLIASVGHIDKADCTDALRDEVDRITDFPIGGRRR